MRICIIYDCLFPWTIGGAERWYRNLAQRLCARGHEITYLTLTQWSKGQEPCIPGVKVVPVGPRMALYSQGRRKIAPPLRFGLGVFLHLLWHGGDYDLVHTASFPFFSLLAIGLIRPFRRFRVVCDWHEVWGRSYWREYLGYVGGEIGWRVQRLCARVWQRAYTFSHLHAQRLAALGLHGSVRVLSGEYEGSLEAPEPTAPAHPPVVISAGRMIPEKRVPLLVDAIALARSVIPQLRAVVFGKGPEFARIRAHIEALSLAEVISLPGFVDADVLSQTMSRALCVVQPSSREGYGMIVVEAAANGVPAVVVEGEDNAAVELIEPGHNGFVAKRAETACLAEEIIRCWRAGDALRTRTREWYRRNAVRLSLEYSLNTVLDDYSAA